MINNIQYPIPTYDSNGKRNLVSVGRDVYAIDAREIGRVRKRNQRNGSCCCPKDELIYCDADCSICRYRNDDLYVSLDAPLDYDADHTLMDILPNKSLDPENLLIKKELYAKLNDVIKSLNPYGRLLIWVVLYGSFRKGAEISGFSSSKLHRDWIALRSLLADCLIDYYLD